MPSEKTGRKGGKARVGKGTRIARPIPRAPRIPPARRLRDLVRDFEPGKSGEAASGRLLEALVAVAVDKRGADAEPIRTIARRDELTDILAASAAARGETADGDDLGGDGAKEPSLDDSLFREAGIDPAALKQIDFTRDMTLARIDAAAAPTLSALARPIAARNLRAALQIGPFRDRLNRDFLIEILQPVKKVAVRSTAGAAPLLLVTAMRLPTTPGTRLTLLEGTVWIAAKALRNDAAASEYIGLRITGGTIEFGAKPTRSGDDLVLAAADKTVRIRLNLERPAAASRIAAAPPESLEIAFAAGAQPAPFKGEASIDDLRFQFKGDGGVRRDARRQRMIFTCKVGPATLEMAELRGAGGEFKGETGTAKGGWAVPITAPANVADVGEAAGESLWVVTLSKPFKAAWQGGPARPVTILKSELAIQAGGFAIDASDAAPDQAGDSHRFLLWRLPSSGHHQRLEARLEPGFEAVLGWSEEFGPATLFEARSAFPFDRPLTATGAVAAIAEAAVTVLILGPSDAQKLIILPRPDQPKALPQRQMLVLENAFLAADTLRFGGLIASLRDGVETFNGIAGLITPLLGWLPILPDPYVDNLCPGRSAFEGREAVATLLALFAWADGEAQFGFLGLIGGPNSGMCDKSERGSRPMERIRGPQYPGQTDQGSLPPRTFLKPGIVADFAVAAFAADTGATAQARTFGTPGEASVTAAKRLIEAERRAGLSAPGAMLLDVSTARHQIGVKIGTSGRDQATLAGTPGAAGFFVFGAQLGTTLSQLQVFALPQIQWEPVRTLAKDQDPVTLGIFPTPLASPDDGGATIIGSNIARLAPVIPDLALDQVLQAFEGGQSFGVVTTLPFGIKTLFSVRAAAGPSRLPDKAVYVRPRFDGTGGPNVLEGGLQLSLRSEGGIEKPGQESPSFEGLTVQTVNGVDLYSGAPLNISVLGATLGSPGSVESMFNNEFANLKPRVPLTRYDISGYGASTFSDWANPKGSFAEVTRSQFQVVVGRTALEVIKVASVIYPWGIRVTRSVTIERKGGGGVLRRDSGWQAQSPGIFDFTTSDAPAQPFEIHPGLIRGIFNATRIRPLANEAISLPSGKVLAMAFDAEVELDGRVGGGRTAAKGLVGYLHLEPLGLAIPPAALAALIENQGPIGGPVDDMINVGGSGFLARALRIEVDTAPAPAPAPGGVAFVGAVRTAPRFSTAGSWAVVQAAPPGGPGPHDATGVDDGAPLIRAGKADPSPDGIIRAPMNGPYRFADARDLFSAANPQLDYGLLQSDSTHRFLFRRPKIEPGGKQVTSTLPPVFADFFAATTSKGLFPPVENGIQLTDQPYRFDVDPPTGFLQLVPDVDISAPRGDLVVSESENDRFRIAYGGSDLRFALRPNDWTLDLDRLELWTDAAGWPDLSGARMDLRGGRSRRAELDRIETLMSPILEDLLSILPFMNNRGSYGPVDLGASNLKVTPKISVAIDKVFPEGNEYVAIRLFAQLDIGVDFKTDYDPALFIGAKAGYDARFSIPIEPYPVAVIFGWSLSLGGKVFLTGAEAGKAKSIIELRVYVGLAFGKNLYVFQAKFVTGAGLLIVGGSESGLGGFIFLEIKAEIVPIAKIKVTGEFACLQITKAGGDKYHRWQGQVGVNVSICWIISIKFSAEVSDEKKIS